MPRGQNQYKPNPTLDMIGGQILHYWKMRKNDKEILAVLKKKHIDLTRYGLGLTRFREMRESMGLIRTRKAGFNVEQIKDTMEELRKCYPKAGAREMVGLLFHEHHMSVAKSVVISYFAIYEPELVAQRKAHRLKRKQFWAAGVNDMIAVDQHDKWKYKYGLALHTGVEPMAGKIKWIKVWWTNSDPRLILSYYLNDVEETGFMPLITQSDPGTENFGIANGHTLLRHWHDPLLQGTLQHRWMREKKNIKPEICWSQLRRRFTPGFEDILDIGINEGWYSPQNYLEAMVFRWVFIPWLQQELDAYRYRVNNTAKRADKNKILPHGVPNDIYENPEDFGILDFKIQVEKEAIVYVRSLYAPQNHAVFQLVPPTFAQYAAQFYDTMGAPAVSRDNAWEIYLALLDRFHELEDIPDAYHADWFRVAMVDEPEPFELLEGLRELENGQDHIDNDGNYYMGGVNNGAGLDEQQLNRMDKLENEDEPELHQNIPEPESNPQDPDPELLVVFSDEEDEDEW